MLLQPCTGAETWCVPPTRRHQMLLIWQQNSEILQNKCSLCSVSSEHAEGSQTLHQLR